MLNPSTVLLNPKVKKEKADCMMEGAKRAAMQVKMTLEPKPLTIYSFLTSFFLSMFTLKLKKYNRSMLKKKSQL